MKKKKIKEIIKKRTKLKSRKKYKKLKNNIFININKHKWYKKYK